MARQLSARIGITIEPTDILIDAPPSKLEVDINIDVVGRDGAVRTLGDVSPVASALAQQQFDNQVKRVRVFVRPELRDELSRLLGPDDWRTELILAAASTENEIA